MSCKSKVYHPKKIGKMGFQEVFNFAIICLGMMLAGASYSIPTPIYPAEALARGVTVFQSGLVLGTIYIVTILCTPLSATLIGKFGGSAVFFTGTLLCGLGNVCFGFLCWVQNGHVYFIMSLLCRSISAVGEALITPTAYPLGANQFSEIHKGKSISFVEACFGIGMVAGPGLGGLLFSAGGFLLPFVVAGGSLILVALLGNGLFKSKSVPLFEERNIGWKELMSCPGMLIYLFGAGCAGSAPAWYSASLEPHLEHKFGLGPEQTGLIMITYSLTYTMFAPMFGALMDYCCLNTRTSVLMGNFLIMMSMLGLGPVPGLGMIESVPEVGFTLFVQGVGTAASCIGTLIGMVQCSEDANMPQTDQTTGMLSGVWLMGLCMGSFLGASGGSAIYEIVGFAWSCTIEAIFLGFSVLIFLLFAFIFPWRRSGYEPIPSSVV